jgi:nucleotide-binding universal stress UspA family protein
MADTRPRVVVGVDGSEDSKQALRWAINHARATGGEVEAVAAPEVALTATITQAMTEADYVVDAEQRLDRTVTEVAGEAPEVPITRTTARGRPAMALIEIARDADVLVIGSHGRGELLGMHLGSTSHYCVNHAPCPVVVVRAQVP